MTDLLRRSFLTVAVLWLLGVTSAMADRAKIVAVPPLQPIEIFGGAWAIFISGPIDRDAASRLEATIRANNIPYQSHVNLDSPGGNLFSAMELGRVIRKYELSTSVKKRGAKQSTQFGESYLTAPGKCLSACALAFIGGRFRFLWSDREIGLHRFYAEKPLDLDGDVAQLASARVVDYISSMGVDTSLFTEMTRAGRDEIFFIAKQAALRLRLANQGQGPTVWTVESHPGALYLKGERDSQHGLAKFLLGCPVRGRVFLFAIFEAKNRDTDLVRMPVHDLQIDESTYRITSLLIEPPRIVNGNLNAAYELSATLVSRLRTARRVGVRLRWSAEAGTFLGFQDLDFSGGVAKFEGILSNCS